MNFITPGYESMELSTQILINEALNRNINVDVLDWQDNFITLSKGDKTEYVKQATRTSKDTYISPLIMENKQVTKKVLKERGINVPEGVTYINPEKAILEFEKYLEKSIVIKPKSTNFGLGITILKKLRSHDEFKEAILEAFKHDSSVLIETFIPGKEYRFLVINDEVVAVLHRVAANVKGDGIHTIEELVKEKNKDPLRGTGYKKPLEIIKTGKEEVTFLKTQGLDLDYIPRKKEKVYLRNNSNISTGGDSIDYTDVIPDSYKQIAIDAARTVGAKICGADIIISDHRKEVEKDKYGNFNYGVIELNFNPALHIHEFPFKGEKHYSEKKVLDLLGF
ncbi:MAG: bifunctional glutamate--cysteine ligase GshA/glutathione synthetase GshB [Desulfobacterales bacterium]|nr:bifunctional glutamate--cysteine ligase GshA/glutathione synthetase GshB [Desulfobacterales bacterium]